MSPEEWKKRLILPQDADFGEILIILMLAGLGLAFIVVFIMGGLTQ